MGIRQTLNEKPVLTSAVTGAIVLIALIYIFFSVFHHPGTSPGQAITQAFYTVDDGKTWFVDDLTKIPPYDHNGKTAVRAVVFKCGDNKYVGHLERFNDATKAKIEQTLAEHPGSSAGVVFMMGAMGEEVKRPGEAKWVTQSDMTNFSAILRPVCPDGTSMPTLVPASAADATDTQ